MTELTKRTTVYLEPDHHRALRLKSLETSRSMSELINEAIREDFAEDADDLLVFRTCQEEPLIPFESFVEELKRSGKI